MTRHIFMTRHVLCCAVLIAAVSQATAQQRLPAENVPPQAKAAPAQQSAMPADAKGLTVAKSAAMAIRFRDVKPADLMLSRLIGINVYNNQNETLGNVEDIVL